MVFERRIVAVFILFMLAGSAACRPTAADRARQRAAIERVAIDTAAKVWHHSVGVDSVRAHGDTTIVWVSPTNWMATDAPQAAVRFVGGGRVAGIEWIMGG